MVIYMTLKQNLIERSSEIKMKLEKEIRALEVPCTISDLMKRCGASRMPIERHLKVLMAMDEYSYLGVTRIGGYDVVFRRASKDKTVRNLVQELEAATMNVTSNSPTATAPAVQPPKTEVEQ